jgi:two-component system heavy metal sensor histidine kinase CusS
MPSSKLAQLRQAKLQGFSARFISSLRSKWKIFHSLRFEITVIYSLILAVILFIFSGVIYLIISNTLYVQLDNELKIKAREISSNISSYLEVKKEDPQALLFAVEKTISSQDRPLKRWWFVGFDRNWTKRLDEQNIRKDYINFVRPDGKPLSSSSTISPQLLKLFLAKAQLKKNKETVFYITHDSERIRVINYPFKTPDGKQFILQVGISPQPVVLLLQNWMNSVFISIPIIIILTSYMGWILASRIVAPVQKITDMANSITYQDLSKRVEPHLFYEEMDSLTQSFNNMFTRLERSFKHIELFSAHVAHELKTPLTIMRGETELALMVERSKEEYKTALTINMEEIEKMLTIIEDLLLLTKLDYQPECFKFEQIDLAEYFRDIFEQSKMLASKKKQEIKLKIITKRKLLIKGDPIHLRRLFFNLINNAIKFTPAEGQIFLKLENIDNFVLISVTDTGPGISHEDIDKIFDRFYTGSHDSTGSGLGLSIASSIVKAHSGKLDVASQVNQGSTFLVILPVL